MKTFKIIIFTVILFLSIIGVSIVIVDPYFHYHKPLRSINYNMTNKLQRYMNDGIIKKFDYNAVITGTSMTENFKSSQFDKIFGTNSIKIPFSGGSYKEIDDNIEKTLKYNQNMKIVFRGVDYGSILSNSENMAYESYPNYLYDDNIFNDYKYILSKNAFLQVIFNIYESFKNKSFKIDFDEYSSWEYEFGKEKVLSQYKRIEKIDKKFSLTEKNKKVLDENIEKNVLDLPKKYPNVKFIYFITPYSIVYWDSLNQKSEVKKQIMAEKYMIEKILEVPNIELYSFFGNYNLITDLDNYKDTAHYISKVNEKILNWISKKEYLLTKDNYQEYINKNLEFYKNYDYDKIYE